MAMLNRTAKRVALVGVPTVVIVGLIALAAPAVAVVAPWLNVERQSEPASAPRESVTEAPEPTIESPPKLSNPLVWEDAEQTDSDGDGYIYAGNGTWFSAKGPGDCPSNAAIHPYGAFDPEAQLGGELRDMGSSEFASGEVGYTADGLIESYTVAPGDALIGIGERFCVDDITIGAYNDVLDDEGIQPGDELVLRP